MQNSLSAERGVTAVIAPVSIDHANFGNGRVAVLALEVVLTKLDVVVVHCKTVLSHEIRKLRVGLLNKSVQRFDLGRYRVLDFKRVLFLEAALARLDRVYQIVLDMRKFVVGDLSF